MTNYNIPTSLVGILSSGIQRVATLTPYCSTDPTHPCTSQREEFNVPLNC